jgi:Raf kinase inhibitor-like YbhB/YbcL family protein
MADRPPLPYDFLPSVPAFTVTSEDITHGGHMADKHVYHSFGMSGDNVSPQLSWSGFPGETKSFAVTCYDPDAPTGSGFWHWIVIDIPATVTSLPAGAGAASGARLPAGAFHVRNDYGSLDFGGAAPPAGDPPHRYVFAVHALDVETLGIDSSVTPAVAGFNLRFHTIARGLLIPVYGH